MELLEVLRKRRSVRNFKEDPLSREQIEGLLEAAVEAPSAGNVQPWFFKVIRELPTKEKLAAAALNQRFMVRAPVIIAVCADRERASRVYGKRGRDFYAHLDAAVAVNNIMLAAAAGGLATCWIGAFHDEQVSRILGVDGEDVRPIALLPVGYPAETPPRPPRRPLEEVVSYDGS